MVPGFYPWLPPLGGIPMLTARSRSSPVPGMKERGGMGLIANPNTALGAPITPSTFFFCVSLQSGD